VVKALEGLIGFLECFQVVANPGLGGKRKHRRHARWQPAKHAESHVGGRIQAIYERGEQGVPPRTGYGSLYAMRQTAQVGAVSSSSA
jgi:hypothetical protein